MTGDDNGNKSGKSAQSSRRDARLAAALRENLRRRKAQERGRASSDEGDGGKTPSGGENP
jgi:hypothetical protein